MAHAEFLMGVCVVNKMIKMCPRSTVFHTYPQTMGNKKSDRMNISPAVYHMWLSAKEID